jgi:RHS repeat-associated protein
MQGAGGVGGLLKQTYVGAAVTNSFVAFDGNGNVGGLVNAADGTSVAQYEYGPFGELIRSTGSMTRANPFRFSTKCQDDESDFSYFGMRYLCTSSGRWLSRDSVDENGGLNVYGFLNNAPINDIDSIGNSPGMPGWPWMPGWDFCQTRTCPCDVDCVLVGNTSSPIGFPGRKYPYIQIRKLTYLCVDCLGHSTNRSRTQRFLVKSATQIIPAPPDIPPYTIWLPCDANGNFL